MKYALSCNCSFAHSVIDYSLSILITCYGVVLASVIPDTIRAPPNKFRASGNCHNYKGNFSTLSFIINGDPRNQAVIIHMDGWNPHASSAKYSISAFNIAHATMHKELRANGNNIEA